MRTKHVLLIILGVILAIITVVVGFTLHQANQQQLALSIDLQYRTRLLADSLKESVEPIYGRNSTTELQKLVDKFASKEHVVGLAIYDNRGAKVAASADLPANFLSGLSLVSTVMDTNKPAGEFIKNEGKSFYVFVEPLRQVDRVIGAFLVAQNADYINSGIRKIWENNLLRLLVQIIIFATIIAFLVHWVIVRPIINLVESVKTARLSGNTDQALQKIKEHAFFKPLVGEIFKMTKSLSDARLSASEEARMRLEKLDSPWTAERLKEFTKAYLKDRPIFLVSNREPYIHSKIKNEITYSVPASGVITALEPIMEACGGLWIAHGSGNADRETADSNGKIAVPPDDPKYTLKRVWLTPKEVEGYYVGFTNEALWPLSHLAHTRPIFRKENWQMYRHVNGKFAATLLAEIKDVQQPLILIQDLHFALLPQMIKASRPDAQIAIFWHEPWPSAEAFSICPWRKEILEGMLGADVIGFHIQQHCNNFLDTVGKEIESIIDFEKFSVTQNSHTTTIRPFPISVAFTNPVLPGETSKSVTHVLKKLGINTEFCGLGVDRLDYIKGIIERMRGIEYFLDAHQEYRGRFTFLQISSPSREGVEKYREYGKEVELEIDRINQKFRMNGWQPIVFERRNYSHAELEPLYREVNFCLITSLHDGMNLVSKEFVSMRDDERGVLILSQFTGAARDLKEALLVNPYSAEEISEAVYRALTMPQSEQHRRMKIMRNSVKNYNVYRWSAELIKAVASLV
ncbi:MAG: trehalose-6-phosphate synthase [bacterium]|nr:trehalose-6-phosphate synthase [bacterium]